MTNFRRLWFYYLASYLVRNYARLFRRLKVEGLELVPLSGTQGLIVASNHASSFDPPLIGSLVPREIHFMAKRELFETQPLRWVCEHLMAFPIDRNKGDTKGIKEALRFLKSGLAVGIFPQGTRNAGDAAALDGAAFLAQRAGVPLQTGGHLERRGTAPGTLRQAVLPQRQVQSRDARPHKNANDADSGAPAAYCGRAGHLTRAKPVIFRSCWAVRLELSRLGLAI